MATVEARRIVRSFGDVHAVDGIDLVVKEGELLVLLGPSGCGKTTLMRLIAGLEAPDSGDILIGGKIVTLLPPRTRNVAMVFQSYALYPHLTVARNISFPLRAAGMAKDKIRQSVEQAARMFGIQHLLQRKPRQLSGGERQRVALARAVVREPVLFLLDEPLSNLDAKLRNAARNELKQFQRRLGTTTIYVTHDQAEAMGLGDRIAVLEAGRVRQVGTPQDIYKHPTDIFVATFIGSPPMNLIAEGEGWLGFRPEDFQPRSTLAGNGYDDATSFRFCVDRIEYLGAERLIYGSIEGRSQQIVISRLPIAMHAELAQGESYEFAVPRGAIERFDRKGHRLNGARP
jgi:multiple sugar transport system ATP-binding protein